MTNDKRQTHFAGQYLPESFKIPKHCDAKQVLEQPRIERGNSFSIMQEGIQKENGFTANKSIQFAYEKDVRTLDGESFDLHVGIGKMTDKKNRDTVFQKDIHAESQPCEWIVSANWEFAPDVGEYDMQIHVTENDGGSTSFGKNFLVVKDHLADKPIAQEFFQGALDPCPVLDLWNNHAEIIDGTIVSKTIYPGTGKGPTEFHVKINKFFKPHSKNTESITLFASFVDSDIPAVLNEGDRAVIYIEPGNQISRYSVKVDKSTYCEPRDYIQIAPVLPNDPNQLVRGPPTVPFDWRDQCVPDYYGSDPNFWVYREYKPPMQQWKVHDIPIKKQKCVGEGEDYVSVQKTGNPDYKYCILLASYDKLVERG